VTNNAELSGGEPMGKVAAGITVSVDGYVAGPDDGPGCGLGIGGERLHYWVFGGPWSYDSPSRGDATGVDEEWLEEVLSANRNWPIAAGLDTVRSQ
jgi:hypothetical protein